MDARGRFLGPVLAGAVADLPIRRVLDIGGSSGICASALVDRYPHVTAAVFERPPVDVASRTPIADRGHADRVGVMAGDTFADDLPAGFDTHLYSHVFHDWDEARVRRLLAASFAALPPGGLLIDHDVHIDAGTSGPLAAAEYSVFLMHATPGKCWSVAELAGMARGAGFASIEHRTTAGDRSIVIAARPR
ncbi:methyltransferase [Streptomyces sp. RFCAC02]|uniref:methyltransferase n=1 Tax=Streptomyces sp. RFCAC02 TaxID=2499143 RepID=UPI00101F3B71|nr:methyltransferase [Streptomyces sp. RFCAC02]